MPNRRNSASFGLWNCRSLNSEARAELVQLMDEYDVDCVALTETRLKQTSDKSFASGIALWNSPATESLGGVGFVLRTKVLVMADFTPISSRIASMKIKVKNGPNNSFIGLIVVYQFTEDAKNVADRNQLHALVEKTYRSLNESCGLTVILEDFNCHFGTKPVINGVLTDPEASPNALAVQQLAERLGLVILSLGTGSTGTWRHPKTGAVQLKDLVLGPKCLRQNYVRAIKTAETERSDHSFVHFDLDLSALKPKLTRASKPAKQVPLKPADKHDSPVVPRSGLKRRANFGETRDERALVRERVILWTESHSNEMAGKVKWSELKKFLVKCQAEVCLPHTAFEQLTGADRETKIGDLAREVSKCVAENDQDGRRRNQEMLVKLISSSSKAKKKEISNETLREHYETLFSKGSELDKFARVKTFSEPLEALTVLPSLKEVEAAVSKIRNNTAPGESGICGDLLKLGGQKLSELLLSFFISLWPVRSGGDGMKIPPDFMGAKITSLYKGKGSKMDPSNYRKYFL